MDQGIASRVVRVMATLFHVKEGEISASTSMDNFEPWDSLQHMNVIDDIEGCFSVTFTPEEIVALRSVSAIVATLEKKTLIKQ